MRRRAVLSLLLALSTAPAYGQSAPIPIPLPKPPPITNQTSGALFDAMLAISRAQQTNPQAAQTASFQYTKAIQQYNSGDVSGARISALQALSTASIQLLPAVVPVHTPSAPLAPISEQRPGTQGGLYGVDAQLIDADSFLALARGIIDECAARHDRRLSLAQRHYTQARRRFAAGDWQGTRVEAKAAIDSCANSKQL